MYKDRDKQKEANRERQRRYSNALSVTPKPEHSAVPDVHLNDDVLLRLRRAAGYYLL